MTLGNIGDLITLVTQLYGNKRIWITEYGYQTNPPGHAPRRLVREAGGVPDAGVRHRQEEPAHRHDALVPAQGRADTRRLAVGAAHGDSGVKKPSFAAFAAWPPQRLDGRMGDRSRLARSRASQPTQSSPTWVVRAALAGWLRAQAAELAATGRVRVLDVGCGVKPYYPFFAAVASEYVGVDVVENPAAELLGPVEALPVDDASFDVVLCTQVLEHCDDPAQAVRELRRVTRARRARARLDARRAGLPPVAGRLLALDARGAARVCSRQNADWARC